MADIYQLWILLAFGGMILIILGIKASRDARRTWEWSTATASITSMGSPHFHSSYDSADGSVMQGYRVVFEFTYTADGTSRWGNSHLEFGPPGTGALTMEDEAQSVSEAALFLRRNPVGTEFTVYLNPADPDEVLLGRPSHPGTGRSAAVVGATAIAIGLLLTFRIAGWAVPVIMAAIGLGLAFLVYRLTYYPYKTSNDPLNKEFGSFRTTAP